MDSGKKTINLAVIGHVDSGKSTLTGQLMLQTGNVDQATIDQYEQEAQAIGKGSFKYAWVSDKSKSERERGVSIDISTFKFESAHSAFNIIDNPGHRDYTKNMLTGTTQADVALLVVSAQTGEFEMGISKNGSTREHSLLAYTTGVNKMVVCINKIQYTEPPYCEARYQEVVQYVQAPLKQIGYNTKEIEFIPMNAWNGENMLQKSDNTPWYEGPTLMEALDAFEAPERPVDKPLRLPIQDVYKIADIGTVPVGIVQTGSLKAGMSVTFSPSGTTAECKSIETYHQAMDQANPGDYVGFNVGELSTKDVKRGFVASETDNEPAVEAEFFKAQIVVMNHGGKIKKGYTPILDCHTAHIPCQFSEIEQKIDRRSGKVTEENPEFIENGDAAIVKMTPKKPMVVEAFSDFPPLGRFTVRDMNQTVAVGIVKEVQKKQQ